MEAIVKTKDALEYMHTNFNFNYIKMDVAAWELFDESVLRILDAPGHYEENDDDRDYILDLCEPYLIECDDEALTFLFDNFTNMIVVENLAMKCYMIESVLDCDVITPTTDKTAHLEVL